MTVKDTLLSFFRSNINTGLSPIEVSKLTGLNKNTVRRVMQEIVREAPFVKRVERGVYESEKITHAFVYKWKGYQDDKVITTTYTADHALTRSERKAVEKQATKNQGNASFISEGESDIVEDFGYDIEESDY